MNEFTPRKYVALMKLSLFNAVLKMYILKRKVSQAVVLFLQSPT